jgi:hypothetical protein
MRRKAGTALGMFGLAQGFVGIAVAFLPAEPNLTLVKVLSVGAVVCIIAGLLIFFWPERAAETTQTATQSGSRNVQIQGQTVNFHGSISTGDEEVPAARLPDGRTLVDVTPAYLASLYGEHTEIQADKLLEAFVGKWMRVSGSVEEVFATDENGACVAFPHEGPDEPSVMMYFRGKAVIDDQLRVLKIGDRITVIGQIESASAGVIVLKNCELERP